VDFRKLARTLPAFTLHWNASRGAKDLHAALLEGGVTLADFQGERYMRLARIKRLLESRRLDDTLRWVDGGRPL
jgi:hypothetical protein